MRAISLSVVLVLAQGCLLQNLASDERLHDAVLELNDQLRWSRVGLAAEHVDPGFRLSFVEAHRHWGHAILIADTDVVSVKKVDGKDGKGAESLVTVSWYSETDMTLRQTTLKQRWHERRGKGYLLVKEKILDGDPRVLAPTSGSEHPAKKVTPTKAS